jgi:hypothetical protein
MQNDNLAVKTLMGLKVPGGQNIRNAQLVRAFEAQRAKNPSAFDEQMYIKVALDNGLVLPSRFTGFFRGINALQGMSRSAGLGVGFRISLLHAILSNPEFKARATFQKTMSEDGYSWTDFMKGIATRAAAFK